MIDYQRAAELSAEHGDSFYIFDRAKFVQNFVAFQDAFRSVYENSNIAYSYKTNYTPAVCRLVDELGGYGEIVSSMELEVAGKAGIDARKIVYNGPYKSLESVQTVLTGGGVVNLDSIRDIELVEELAPANLERPGRVALRCNFDIGAGRVSRFGMDVEGEEFAEVLRRVRTNASVELVGLHCHFQDRDLALFESRTKKLLETTSRVFGGEAPELLNVGGGYFGPLPDSLRDRYAHGVPSYDEYAATIGGLVAEHYAGAANPPELLTEPGTALVADTFRFITRVVGRKQIRDKRFLFVAGSMFNISPYSRVTGLPVIALNARTHGSGPSVYDVCGYTCIEKDVLSVDVELEAEVDDFLIYENVGSYSIGMKPPFILPNVPILMRIDDDFEVIKRGETTDDLFGAFVWS